MYFEHWHFVETTASGHPILRENEKDIYVEHSVGLYHGKSKIINKQKGRVYLTSQRVIYVDDTSPTKESVCLELDDIVSFDYSSKFLKKSAKLIVFLRIGNSSTSLRSLKEIKSTWICPICMMSNEIVGEFTENLNPPPTCVDCGVPADYEMIKNSIAIVKDPIGKQSQKISENVCPACTFINHPLIRNCEICGTRLPSASSKLHTQPCKDSRVRIELETKDGLKDNERPYVQLSFRNSDGVLFWQAISNTVQDLEKEKNKGVFNKNVISVNGVEVNSIDPVLVLVDSKLSQVGIASLEKTRENQIIKNDIMLSNALTDLNKLMALASDIEKLYQTTTKQTNRSKVPLLIIDRDKFLNKSLFLDEIAREIYGFVMTEFKEQKEKEGGILVTMVDLYAMYNKAMRIGTGLISPQEMKDACERFSQLGLSGLQLTKINKRVLCISSGRSFEFVKGKIITIVEVTPGADLLQLTQRLNDNGSNSWTIGIIMEVLQNCINEGELLIDEQISGIHYYINSDWKI